MPAARADLYHRLAQALHEHCSIRPTNLIILLPGVRPGVIPGGGWRGCPWLPRSPGGVPAITLQ